MNPTDLLRTLETKPGDHLVTVMLAEYEAVKREQVSRIKTRDHLFIATLTTAAAIVGVTLNVAGQAALLLLLPPVALILGWNYLVNDEKISAAGRYLRNILAPQLALQAGAEVLRWEAVHRSDGHRRIRKNVQLVIDLFAFVALPVAGLLTFWTVGPLPALLVVISTLEMVALVGLAVAFANYSDRSPK